MTRTTEVPRKSTVAPDAISVRGHHVRRCQYGPCVRLAQCKRHVQTVMGRSPQCGKRLLATPGRDDERERGEPFSNVGKTAPQVGAVCFGTLSPSCVS